MQFCVWDWIVDENISFLLWKNYKYVNKTHYLKGDNLNQSPLFLNANAVQFCKILTFLTFFRIWAPNVLFKKAFSRFLVWSYFKPFVGIYNHNAFKCCVLQTEWLCVRKSPVYTQIEMWNYNRRSHDIYFLHCGSWFYFQKFIEINFPFIGQA